MPALLLFHLSRVVVLTTCFLSFSLPLYADTWPDDDWLTAPVGIGPALKAFERYSFPKRDDVRREGIRTDAVVVIRDGWLVYERYAGPTHAQTPHLTWSVSKSVLATLLGVAQGEGRFQLDDPVARYYPALARYPDITLRHLLNWSSGLEWRESYEFAPLKSSVVAMLYTRGRSDMAGFVAAADPVAVPGRRFHYSSGDSNLLAAALKGMIGPGYADYPWAALFEPLGIRSAVWERDASGTFVGASYLYMSARDLARVGLLMQRHGRWRERQLLPRSWVKFNLTPFARYRPSRKDVGEVPGGQWWLNRPVQGTGMPLPDAPVGFAAFGHWGQALYVLPEQKLVIVRYADDRDGSYRDNEFLRLAVAAFSEKTSHDPAIPLVDPVLPAVVQRVALDLGESSSSHKLSSIISAFTAKEYCSCHYVTGNSADYCRAYVQLYMPISGFSNDDVRRRVTARVLDSTQTSVWLGLREGCRLMPKADRLPD